MPSPTPLRDRVAALHTKIRGTRRHRGVAGRLRAATGRESDRQWATPGRRR